MQTNTKVEADGSQVFLKNNQPNVEKKAKWNNETKIFFETAQDHSLDLDIMISLACRSQTGIGFAELVNAINDEKVLSKIKKVNIHDTTYLYRHFYERFAKCNLSSIPTEWYQTNRKAIEKLKPEVELKCWATEINSKEYYASFRQVMNEFNGDESGSGPVIEFRDTVIAEAAVNAHKHGVDRQSCVNFILEECAHLLAQFRFGGNIVYPMKLYSAGDYMIRRYQLYIRHFSYRTSN